jgi:hypothetical protein
MGRVVLTRERNACRCTGAVGFRCAIARTVRRATRQTQRDRQKELTALAAVEAGRQLKSRDRSGPRGARQADEGKAQRA